MLPGTRLLTPVSGPNFAMRPFRIEARIAPLAGGEEGVLFAYGRRAAGFALYLKDGRLCFDYNLAGRHSVLRSRDPVAAGRHAARGRALLLGRWPCPLRADRRRRAARRVRSAHGISGRLRPPQLAMRNERSIAGIARTTPRRSASPGSSRASLSRLEKPMRPLPPAFGTRCRGRSKRWLRNPLGQEAENHEGKQVSESRDGRSS